MNEFYPQYPQYGMQEMSTPSATLNNIKAFIATSLNMSLEVLEFVKMSEPFANNGEEARHACPVSLLAVEHYKVMQLDYFNKATIDIGYCPNCCKVIYYVEKHI